MSANDVWTTFVILLVICILGAFIAVVRMCAKDAIRRGKSPWLLTLLVIGFFPAGLLARLLFRPNIVTRRGRRGKFKLNDFHLQ